MTGEEKFNLAMEILEDQVERKSKLEKYWHDRMREQDDPYDFDTRRHNWIQAKSLRLGVSECLNDIKQKIKKIEEGKKSPKWALPFRFCLHYLGCIV